MPAPFRPSAPSAAGSRDVNGPGAGPESKGRTGRGRSVVAAVVVVALLAVVGLVAWRATRPVTPQVATPSGTSAPTPSGTATSPTPTSTDHPAELAAFYTQAVHWEPCEGSPAHRVRHVSRCRSTTPSRTATPSARPAQGARDRPVEEGSARCSSTPAGPVRPGVEYAQFSTLRLQQGGPCGLRHRRLRPARDRPVGRRDVPVRRGHGPALQDDPTPDDAAERSTSCSATRTRSPSGVPRRGGERALHLSTHRGGARHGRHAGPGRR